MKDILSGLTPQEFYALLRKVTPKSKCCGDVFVLDMKVAPALRRWKCYKCGKESTGMNQITGAPIP